MSLPAQEALLVRWLRTSKRVLAFCGAGVSVESGVPTFRGAGGLWEGNRVEDVATPSAFLRDPQRVWLFYARRQEQLPEVHPNPAHHILAAMERRYPGFLLVTQNVDDLHERAGSRELVKLHGTLTETRCSGCNAVRRLPARSGGAAEPVSSAAIAAGELPHCACGELLRPNVIWFGELLDPAHLQRTDRFIRGGVDLLLVIGTSGEVSGGYGLTGYCRAFGARIVEINPEASVLSDEVDLALRAPAGELLARVWPCVEGGGASAS